MTKRKIEYWVIPPEQDGEELLLGAVGGVDVVEAEGQWHPPPLRAPQGVGEQERGHALGHAADPVVAEVPRPLLVRGAVDQGPRRGADDAELIVSA